jgi:hypothetical protein
VSEERGVNTMTDEREEWIVGKTRGYYQLLEGEAAFLTAVDIKTLVPKSTREAAEAERDEARKALEDVRVFLDRIERGDGYTAPMQARSAMAIIDAALSPREDT